MTGQQLDEYEVVYETSKGSWKVHFFKGSTGYIQAVVRDLDNMAHEVPLLLDHEDMVNSYEALKKLHFDGTCPTTYVVAAIVGCIRTCLRPLSLEDYL